jgi:hypothetical protein
LGIDNLSVADLFQRCICTQRIKACLFKVYINQTAAAVAGKFLVGTVVALPIDLKG